MAAFGANGLSIDQFPSTGLTVEEPSGSTDGQLMVVQGVVSDATGITATGWNITVHPVAVGGVDFDYVVLWKIRSGSAQVTVSWTNSGYGDLTMHRFTGVHASSPVESITAGTATTSANKVAPSVNSTYTNSLLADFYVEDDFNSWTPDAAFTERFDGASSYGTGMSTLQLSAAGATGTHTHVSVNATGGIAVRMVIVDASPTAGATIEQEGFAFGDDDGNEASHTLDTQDTNVTVALGVKTLRMLLNATDDPASIAFKLKYQKNGSGGYIDVPLGTTRAGTTPLIEAGDATESGDDNTTPTSPWPVSRPTLSTGDLIILCIAWDDSTNNTGITVANGPNGETWTQINSVQSSASTEIRITAYYTVATGAWGAGSISVTPAANEQWTASVLKVPAGEFDSSTPIGGNGGNASAGTAESTLNSPAVTAGSSDGSGRLIWIVAADQDPQSSLLSGWSEITNTDRGQVSLSVNSRDTAVSDSESISAGNGTRTIASDSWAGVAFVVRAPIVSSDVYVSASANVTAGGEATTARLTAPSGKTTSDFDTGRRWDNENGSDSIDITADDYTEVEWVLTTQSPATTSDYFDFRVYNGNTALDTYTVTPRWTIGSGGAVTNRFLSILGVGT